jgi:hypothetical protein
MALSGRPSGERSGKKSLGSLSVHAYVAGRQIPREQHEIRNTQNI